ncbi:MAG: hypothetical protein ACI9VR_000504 [Cognaticolwellia sp.]|jgi:hypothetical protein
MILLLLACATLSSDAPSDAEPQAAVSDAPAVDVPKAEDLVTPTELLPPHFSADQIRDAMPVGTTLVFRTATIDTLADGSGIMAMESKDQQWEVLAADLEQVTIRYTVMQGLSEPTERTHAWSELASHSQFPEQMTTRQDGVSVTVPAGTFDCIRYTVREAGGEVSVYDFAQGMAGPPLQMVQTVSGQERMRMSLVRRAIP